MSRSNILLLAALIASALSVVYTTYQQRHLFTALERARAQQQQLQQEGALLSYQQRALSKTARVERLAAHRLKMGSAVQGVTQYWIVPGIASASHGEVQ